MALKASILSASLLLFPPLLLFTIEHLALNASLLFPVVQASGLKAMIPYFSFLFPQQILYSFGPWTASAKIPPRLKFLCMELKGIEDVECRLRLQNAPKKRGRPFPNGPGSGEKNRYCLFERHTTRFEWLRDSPCKSSFAHHYFLFIFYVASSVQICLFLATIEPISWEPPTTLSSGNKKQGRPPPNGPNREVKSQLS